MNSRSAWLANTFSRYSRVICSASIDENNKTWKHQIILNEFHERQEGAEADGTSVISYSPQSDRDYGSLICWARNVIGEQREPCVYRIFLGGAAQIIPAWNNIKIWGNTLRSVVLQCVRIHRAIVRCWIKRLRRWKFGAGRDSTVVTRNCFNSKSSIRSRPFSFTTNPDGIRICASATSNPESSSSFKFRHSINGVGRHLSLWRHTPSKSLTNKQVRSQ